MCVKWNIVMGVNTATYGQDGEPGLLRKGDLTSDEFRKQLLPIIQGSFFQKEASMQNFHIVEYQMICNNVLNKQYTSRRDELRKKCFPTRIAESFAFVSVENENISPIVENGVGISNLTYSVLGNPLEGVCLQKHADVLSKTPLTNNQKGKFIVFKLILGRKFTVSQCMTNMRMPPEKGYDCHISTLLTKNMSGMPIDEVFDSTQYYLYEHDSNGTLVKHPTHIKPIAVVTYSYKSALAQSVNGPSVGVPTLPKRCRQVIWEGKLKNDGAYVTTMRLISSFLDIGRFYIGAELNITSTKSWSEFQKIYLDGLPTLDKYKENYQAAINVRQGMNYVVLGKLIRGRQGCNTKGLQDLAKALESSRKVGIVDIGERKAFLLPHCEGVTKEFRLLPITSQEQNDTSMPFQVILMSRTSMTRAHQSAKLRVQALDALIMPNEHAGWAQKVSRESVKLADAEMQRSEFRAMHFMPDDTKLTEETLSMAFSNQKSSCSTYNSSESLENNAKSSHKLIASLISAASSNPPSSLKRVLNRSTSVPVQDIRASAHSKGTYPKKSRWESDESDLTSASKTLPNTSVPFEQSLMPGVKDTFSSGLEDSHSAGLMESYSPNQKDSYSTILNNIPAPGLNDSFSDSPLSLVIDESEGRPSSALSWAETPTQDERAHSSSISSPRMPIPEFNDKIINTCTSYLPDSCKPHAYAPGEGRNAIARLSNEKSRVECTPPESTDKKRHVSAPSASKEPLKNRRDEDAGETSLLELSVEQGVELLHNGLVMEEELTAKQTVVMDMCSPISDAEVEDTFDTLEKKPSLAALHALSRPELSNEIGLPPLPPPEETPPLPPPPEEMPPPPPPSPPSEECVSTEKLPPSSAESNGKPIPVAVRHRNGNSSASIPNLVSKNRDRCLRSIEESRGKDRYVPYSSPISSPEINKEISNKDPRVGGSALLSREEPKRLRSSSDSEDRGILGVPETGVFPSVPINVQHPGNFPFPNHQIPFQEFQNGNSYYGPYPQYPYPAMFPLVPPACPVFLGGGIPPMGQMLPGPGNYPPPNLMGYGGPEPFMPYGPPWPNRFHGQVSPAQSRPITASNNLPPSRSTMMPLSPLLATNAPCLTRPGLSVKVNAVTTSAASQVVVSDSAVQESRTCHISRNSNQVAGISPTVPNSGSPVARITPVAGNADLQLEDPRKPSVADTEMSAIMQQNLAPDDEQVQQQPVTSISQCHASGSDKLSAAVRQRQSPDNEQVQRLPVTSKSQCHASKSVAKRQCLSPDDKQVERQPVASISQCHASGSDKLSAAVRQRQSPDNEQVQRLPVTSKSQCHASGSDKKSVAKRQRLSPDDKQVERQPVASKTQCHASGSDEMSAVIQQRQSPDDKQVHQQPIAPISQDHAPGSDKMSEAIRQRLSPDDEKGQRKPITSISQCHASRFDKEMSTAILQRQSPNDEQMHQQPITPISQCLASGSDKKSEAKRQRLSLDDKQVERQPVASKTQCHASGSDKMSAAIQQRQSSDDKQVEWQPVTPTSQCLASGADKLSAAIRQHVSPDDKQVHHKPVTSISQCHASGTDKMSAAKRQRLSSDDKQVERQPVASKTQCHSSGSGKMSAAIQQLQAPDNEQVQRLPVTSISQCHTSGSDKEMSTAVQQYLTPDDEQVQRKPVTSMSLRHASGSCNDLSAAIRQHRSPDDEQVQLQPVTSISQCHPSGSDSDGSAAIQQLQSSDDDQVQRLPVTSKAQNHASKSDKMSTAVRQHQSPDDNQMQWQPVTTTSQCHASESGKDLSAALLPRLSSDDEQVHQHPIAPISQCHTSASDKEMTAAVQQRLTPDDEQVQRKPVTSISQSHASGSDNDVPATIRQHWSPDDEQVQRIPVTSISQCHASGSDSDVSAVIRQHRSPDDEQLHPVASVSQCHASESDMEMSAAIRQCQSPDDEQVQRQPVAPIMQCHASGSDKEMLTAVQQRLIPDDEQVQGHPVTSVSQYHLSGSTPNVIRDVDSPSPKVKQEREEIEAMETEEMSFDNELTMDTEMEVPRNLPLKMQWQRSKQYAELLLQMLPKFIQFVNGELESGEPTLTESSFQIFDECLGTVDDFNNFVTAAFESRKHADNMPSLDEPSLQILNECMEVVDKLRKSVKATSDNYYSEIEEDVT